jgi:hypothetical protein
MAEDGVIETRPEGPPGFRPGPVAWLVRPPRKVADSNGTVLPAHPLATEPGPCPVHLPCAGRESNPHVRRHTLLGRARLPFTPPAPGPADCAGVGGDLGVLGRSRTRNRRLLKPTSLPGVGVRAREPPPGADPGRPPYESGAAAVRGGVAASRGFEPRFPESESGVLPVGRRGIGCVRRRGFEPRTYGLRVRGSSQLS